MPQSATALEAALAVAEGHPGAKAPPAPPATGLSLLRQTADVLAAGNTAPRAIRALGTELFRSQADFNHAAADLVEDLPWFHGRPGAPDEAARRLRRWERFSARPPLRPGARGAAVFLAKSAALIASERVLAALFDALRASNLSVVDFLLAAARGARLPPIPDLHTKRLMGAPWLSPWLEAQQRFLITLGQLFASSGEVLWSRSAAAQAALAASLPLPELLHPPVSVLLVGRAQPSNLERALEVLCPDEPGQASGPLRRGDVADARGEIILRLPEGEVLTPQGLAALAQAFANPEVELAYGDGVLPDGSIAFRPGWSPETLWSWTYTGGCFAVRAAMAKKAQLSRARPALDWLLAPHFTEKRVARIPRVVSRCTHAEGGVRELAVVEDDLKRRGVHGVVRIHGGRREVAIDPQPGTKVSVIVPFRDKVQLLEGLWQSLLRFEPGVQWELILANNGSRERRTARFLSGLRDSRVHVFDWNHPFNFSAINNAAVPFSRGQLLLFLNNDVAARRAGWMSALAGYAQLPEVGIAGARLHYADGSLQHAGVAIGLKGLAGHVFARWRPEYGPTPFGPPDVTRNWSAVTGACLMIRREVFEAVGRFDERLAVSGGDIALCLKVRARGLRVVCVAEADLWHFESQSRGRDPVPRSDVLREAVLYKELLERGDPLYHPLLSTEAAHGGAGLRVEDPAEHAVRTLVPWL